MLFGYFGKGISFFGLDYHVMLIWFQPAFIVVMYFWEWEFGCPLGIHPIEVGILLELYLLVQKQQNWAFLKIFLPNMLKIYLILMWLSSNLQFWEQNEQ